MATYCPKDLASRELSCPICFEDYDIHEPRRHPKLLLCLHTFCADCIRLLCRRDGTLECSMCRMVHTGVVVEELFDNHVIFTYLRTKFEESDLELARRIDREMRDQTDSCALVSTPVSTRSSVRVQAPALTRSTTLPQTPASASIIFCNSTPDVFTLDSTIEDNEEDEEEEEEEAEEGETGDDDEGVEEEEEEVDLMPQMREENDWSDEQVEEEEEEPEVNHDDQLADICESYDHDDWNDEEDIQYEMENDEHDELDEEEEDQCFTMSLLNAFQGIRDDDSSLSYVSNSDIYDDLDNSDRAVEDDEEGWHSASEQCSPEPSDIVLDSCEDLDYTEGL